MGRITLFAHIFDLWGFILLFVVIKKGKRVDYLKRDFSFFIILSCQHAKVRPVLRSRGCRRPGGEMEKYYVDSCLWEFGTDEGFARGGGGGRRGCGSGGDSWQYVSGEAEVPEIRQANIKPVHHLL